jgi:hypothetical protein
LKDWPGVQDAREVNDVKEVKEVKENAADSA